MIVVRDGRVHIENWGVKGAIGNWLSFKKEQFWKEEEKQ